MAKTKRHVELEQVHLDFIQDKLPGMTLSYVLNELLYQLHLSLMKNPPAISDLFVKSADNSKEAINMRDDILTKLRDHG